MPSSSTSTPAAGAPADVPADDVPALPPIVDLSGTVGSDRRFTLRWQLDPVYDEYEIHESAVDPADTLKATVSLPPRVSNPLTARPTPLRYGVRGRTAGGDLGPFGDAVEVLVRESGGTVTVTGEPFTLQTDGPHVKGGDLHPGDPTFPGDLIPKYWKLTTTLPDDHKTKKDKDGHTSPAPLEVLRKGGTTFHGKPVDLDTYEVADRWRLTHEQGRWGIKITCPADGITTANSPNMRWELRAMSADGSAPAEFALTDDAPILDSELCVQDLQGNHAVLSQIHGQTIEKGKKHDDDLTVWRAEPNDDGETYSLWITNRDDPHGGNHGKPVDAKVKYNQVIRIGFRPAKNQVGYVYNDTPLEYTLTDDGISTDNYYKAGLYLQVKAKKTTSGTIILYSAEISGG